MRAKGLLSVVMTGAMMMGVLSGCGFEPDITWTDTADGSESSYKVTVVVAHDGKLNIKSEQTVKDGDTLNFIATPSKDGDHRITGLMIDGVKRTDYTGELPLEGEVKISLENINQDMTVVVLCDNETGGLGGVDGVVTGLDGSDSNDDHEDDEDKADSTSTVDEHAVSVLARLIDDNDGQEALDGYETVGAGDIVFNDDGESTTPDDVGAIDFESTVTDSEALTFTIHADPYYEVTEVTAHDEDGKTVDGGSLSSRVNDQYTYTIPADYVAAAQGEITITVTYDQLTATMMYGATPLKEMGENGATTLTVTENETIDESISDFLSNLKVVFTRANGTEVSSLEEPYDNNTTGHWTITYKNGGAFQYGDDSFTITWKKDGHEPYEVEVPVDVKSATIDVPITIEGEGYGSVTVTVDGTQVSIVDGKVNVPVGKEMTVEAKVNSEAYTAKVAVEGASGESNTGTAHTFTPTENTTIKVTFTKKTYNVTVVKDGNGTGDVQVNGTSVTTPVTYGDKVTITVKPDTGSKVTSATVTIEGSEPITLGEANNYSYEIDSVSNNITVKVTFEKQTFDVNVTSTPADGGSVNDLQKEATYGEPVTFTIKPNDGYKVSRVDVSVNQGTSITNLQPDDKGVYTIEGDKVTGDIKIDVTYELMHPDTVNVTVDSSGSYGSFKINEKTYSTPASVKYGDDVKLTVTPDKFHKVTSVNATVGSETYNLNATTSGGVYTYTLAKEYVTGDVTFNVTFSKVELEMEGTINKTYYLNDDDGNSVQWKDLDGLSVKIKGTSTDVTDDGTFEIVSPDGGAFTADDIKTDTHQPTVKVQWTSSDGSISCTGTFNVTVYAMTSDAASKLEGEFTTKYLDQFNVGREDKKSERAGKAGSNITEAMDAIYYDGTYDTGNVRVKNEQYGGHDYYQYIRKTVIVTSQAEAEKAFKAFYSETVGPAIDGAGAQLWFTGAYVFIDLNSTTGECTMGVVYDGFHGA